MLQYVAVAYGLICLFMLAIRLSIEGNTRLKPSSRFWRLVSQERLTLFDLTQPPPDLPGYEHAFKTLSSGLKVHYLRSRGKKETPENLLVLFHGFPDTHRLWTRLLTSLPATATENCTIIVPDIPGFGGSDTLPDYKTDTTLNAIAEFVLAIREDYLPRGSSNSNGRVVVAGHDWGSILTAMLASDVEAANLADHFLLISAGSPMFLVKNVEHRRELFRAHMTAARKELSSPSLNTPARVFFNLSRAFTAISPVMSQLLKSYYVFMFNVPTLFLPLLQVGNDCFMRILASLATADAPAVSSTSKDAGSNDAQSNALAKSPDKEAIRARHYAGFSGPDSSLLNSSPGSSADSNLHYGSSVRQRIENSASLSVAVRLYREGLLTTPWRKKGLNTDVAARLAALPDKHVQAREAAVEKAFLRRDVADVAPKAPTTLIWANDDVAQDARVIVEGVDTGVSDVKGQEAPGFDAWLPRGQGIDGEVIGGVIRTNGFGHWLPVTSGGVDVILGVLKRTIAL